MKYKIIETLGSGVVGTTYKVEINKKYYALKINKISHEDATKISKANKNITSDVLDLQVLREIFFAKRMNSVPNHLMKIYKYKIKKNCKHIQPFHLYRNQDKDVDNWMNELDKSKYCIEYVLDLKDGILYNIIDQLTSNQIYSMVIQITYAIYLMHSKEFYHCDIHSENIAYVKTDIEYLNIFDYQIPTFGYIYSLIDYGAIRSREFKFRDDDIKFFEHPINKLRDNYRFISSTMTHKLFKYMEKNNIQFNEFKKNVINTNEFNQLFLQYPLNSFDSILPLLHSSYPDVVLNLIGIDQNYSKYNEFSKCYLTKDQVLYFLTNIDNPTKIVAYFYNLLDM